MVIALGGAELSEMHVTGGTAGGGGGDDPLPPDIWPAIMYFSALGDDNFGDGSMANPWRSVDKANQVYAEGKTFYFRGGDTFPGTLRVRGKNNKYYAYGSGKPIISAGMGRGFECRNKSGVEVNGLRFQGISQLLNPNHGIYFANDFVVSNRLTGCIVRNCEVTEFGWNGIYATSKNSVAGYDGLLIENNTVWNCTGENLVGATAGIEVDSQDFWGLYTHSPAHVNITIQGNYVSACKGRPGAANHVGSGIILSQCEGGLIFNNTAEDCGDNSTNQAGPVGIWAWDAKSVVIRKNIVRRQGTAGPDGSAFDLDGGCVDCVMEYNYSTGCKGPGILLFAFDDTPSWSSGHRLLDYVRNTARFNISIYDGDNDEYSKYGIFIGTMRPVTSDFKQVYVYNNTVITRNNGAKRPLTFNINTFNQVSMDHAEGVVANNMIIQLGTSPLIDMRRNSMVVAGNVFWSPTGATMRYFGYDWPDYEDWSNSTGDDGQPYGPKERLHGNYSFYTADPGLVDPYSTAIANLRPRADAACIGIGLDLLAEFGIPRATEDFLGVAIPSTATLHYPGALQPVAAATNRITAPNDISNPAWFIAGGAATIVGGQQGMFGSSAQKLQITTGTTYAEIAQQRTYPAGAKTVRRGCFVRPVDVPAGVLGNWGPAYDPSEYWHTWFNLLTENFDNAEAFGWFLGNVKNMRMQKRPNGFYLLMCDVVLNPAWTSDYISGFASNTYANVPPWGIAGDNNRGLVFDGFFEYLIG